jgi:type VII secretion-associated serine protease mycosin
LAGFLGTSAAALGLVLALPATPVWAVSVAARAAAAACGPVVTDPLVEPPWGLTRLRPDLAWPLTSGAGVRVAVIDSGVSPDHPSLRGKVVAGRDLLAPPTGLGQCDENGHGTLIAGIIAGREVVSGGFRFHGVAPGASIVPVRVLRDQRRTFEADLSSRIATAIRWAVDEGSADVVNLSLTTPDTAALRRAVEHALAQGVVLVAAAGNEGGTQQGQAAYPAAYPGVIGVAGVGTQDEHITSSSPGPHVDVAAPGVRVAGPSPAGDGFLYTEEGGTSFATAYVSGVAALIRGYAPELTPAQVVARITQTADHPADVWNPQVGYGVVDPVRAVATLAQDGAVPAREPGEMPALVAAPEPDRRTAILAAWIAAAGVFVILLTLVAVPVARRGRQRRWRSGTLESRETLL